MKKNRWMFPGILCMAAVIWATGLSFVPVYGGQQESETAGGYAEDEILVVFESDVNKNAAKQIVKEQDGESMVVLDTPEEEITGLVQLPENQPVEEAIAQYEADPEVAYAQPNYKYRLADDGNASAEPASAGVNDSRAAELWHMDMIQVYQAWELLQSMPHEKVRVAVLDTGADLGHEDLQLNINEELCADLSGGTRQPLQGDTDGHGTHVTGIIAATANNGKGVAGVAAGIDNSSVEAFAVNVFQGKDAYTSTIIAALQYAVEKNAKVINMSLGYEEETPGGDPEDRLLESAVKKAGDAGASVIAAAGNGSGDHTGNTIPNYPADFDACISVISVDQNKQRSGFSNYGNTKDISAPGEQILSLKSGGGYVSISGTSMATPVVSGAAALLYSVDPNMTPDRVKEILYASAEDIYTKGWDIQSGYGIVNAFNALAMTQSQSAAGLKLSRTGLSLKPGQSSRLDAAVFGVSGSGVLWTSSAPSVASVNNGTVTAKKPGSALIRAEVAENSGLFATCKVTVTPYRITYKLNGGKNNSKNPASYYGKTVTLKNPVRAGYTFAGWYKDSGYRSKVTSFSRGDYTLYARWAKVKVAKQAVKVKQAGAGKVTVTCKKTKGVKYQVAVSTSRNFSRSRTKYKTSSTRNVSFTKLKQGKTCYVRARAYKIDSAGKKVYGSYSRVKKVKLKK